MTTLSIKDYRTPYDAVVDAVNTANSSGANVILTDGRSNFTVTPGKSTDEDAMGTLLGEMFEAMVPGLPKF